MCNCALSDKDFAEHEATARSVAKIMGDYCAAAQAIAELDERRKRGEEANLFAFKKSWYVRHVGKEGGMG